MLAVTGEKDLQVRPDDLAVIASTAPSVTVQRVPDRTHTLRRQPGQASLSAYRRELREPVDRDVLAAVVDWSRGIANRRGGPAAG